MPILFKRNRRLIPPKKTATYFVTKEFLGRNICVSPDENGVVWFAVESTDDGIKPQTKSKKSKTLSKLKSLFQKRKRKSKVCKQCRQVNKICKCKIEDDTGRAAIIAFNSPLNFPFGNINHSSSGPDSTFNSCKLKSFSCTTANESPTKECLTPVVYRKHGKTPDLQKFCKYIPIRKVWGPLYPKGYVGDSRKVWLDMQMWYSRYYEQKLKQQANNNLNTSKSETNIKESGTKSPLLNTLDWDIDVSSERVDFNPEEENNKSNLKQRFLLRPNAQYISMVGFTNRNKCRMQLFIHYSGFDEILHLKTEMIVACMRSFIQSDGDFEVFWIADLSTVLPTQHELYACRCINPEVAPELSANLTRARAALFVCRKASILLRHQQTCFLDSMSVAAGLNRSQLVVLPHVLNRCELEKSVSGENP